MSPGPPGVARAEIIALLQEGRSDRYIARTLHTNPKRARALRAELGLPKAKRTVITLEQAWKARAKPTEDGHLAWTGSVREGVPVAKHEGEEYSARRIAFRLAHGREPEGHVHAGCGWVPCVKPEHVEDQPMREANRRADRAFDAIFGGAA